LSLNYTCTGSNLFGNMEDVLLGDPEDLEYNVRNRVSFNMDRHLDEEQFDRLEKEYGFRATCREGCEGGGKCRCFSGKKVKLSIRKVKDQILAWRVINYLAENGCIQNASHWRTEWKRENAPHTLLKPRGAGGGGKLKGKTKKELEEEEKQLLLNPEYRREKIEARKKELRENMEKADKAYKELEKKWNEWKIELEQYEGEDLYVPKEHTIGGGVDQGELSDEPEEQEEEEEEPQVFQEQEQTEEQVQPPQPPQKKKGRPKKAQGQVVGEIVERLEQQT